MCVNESIFTIVRHLRASTQRGETIYSNYVYMKLLKYVYKGEPTRTVDVYTHTILPLCSYPLPQRPLNETDLFPSQCSAPANTVSPPH